MFHKASSFDANLTNWDVSKTWDMAFMFQDTNVYVGVGLDQWQLNSAVNVSDMFCNAKSFQKLYLISWDIEFEDVFCY